MYLEMVLFQVMQWNRESFRGGFVIFLLKLLSKSRLKTCTRNHAKENYFVALNWKTLQGPYRNLLYLYDWSFRGYDVRLCILNFYKK